MKVSYHAAVVLAFCLPVVPLHAQAERPGSSGGQPPQGAGQPSVGGTATAQLSPATTAQMNAMKEAEKKRAGEAAGALRSRLVKAAATASQRTKKLTPPALPATGPMEAPAPAGCTAGDEKFHYSPIAGGGSKKELVCRRAVVQVQDINPIRYSYRLGTTVTMTDDSVKLETILPFAKPKAAASAEVPEGESATETTNRLARNTEKGEPFPTGVQALHESFRVLLGYVNALGRGEDPLTRFLMGVNDLATSTELATSQVAAFRKDEGNSDPNRALTGIREMLEKHLDPLSVAEWPTPAKDRVSAYVQILRQELENLELEYRDVFDQWAALTFNSQSNGQRFRAALQRLSEADRSLDGLSETERQWRTAHGKLMSVRRHLLGIYLSPGKSFFLSTCQICGSRGKENTVALKVKDLTEENATESSTDLLTLVCPSPLFLSYGVAFSNLDEREFAFVKAPAAASQPAEGGANAQVIGYNSVSRFRPMPAILLNMRLPCWPCRELSLLYSFGVSVDLNKGTLGPDLEILTGPSVLLGDRVVFTVGPHLGRTVHLQPCFTTGPPGYTGITEPPTHKRYNIGLGFAISFRP